MFEDLAGKSALVTGASRGLGLHFAELLAGHGVNLTLTARDKAALATAQARISSDGGVAAIVDLDVTDKASVEAAIAFVPGTLDILVNNAGITAGGSALTIEEHDWDQVIDTNLKGSFLVAQAAAKRVSDEKTRGAIVNIASILGLRVAGGLAAYAASKAAVVQLTGALALEWARYGIRVNALCPGYIETDLNRDFFATEADKHLIQRIPQRRFGKPENLDAPLLLLCSKVGDYITGATLVVDGGHLVSTL
ncbi:MAG: glucose 1-dehydrogenase [Hyphomicrobiales bacterium]|nr:glucose 1-dehydrogenase [Hyphomicrobiales bacterium]